MIPRPSRAVKSLDAPSLHLWYADPADLADPAVEQSCAALLGDAERARAARFRFGRHRREYLATHALTRLALSRVHALPPQAWSFSLNACGKPSPIPDCGLRFNQSHAAGLAVSLIAREAEVGVDVEAFTRAEEILALATHVFSPAEREQLDALPAAERPARALSLWTLKEAYIKARGMGLSLPLLKISFLFGDAEEIRLETDPAVDPAPARWRFCLLAHAGHRVALAAESPAASAIRPALEILEARPLLAPPTPLPAGDAHWFPFLAAQNPSRAAR